MLSLEQLLTLGLDEANSPSMALKGTQFTLRRELIYYPQFSAAIREIAHIHSRWRECQLAGGLLFVGQSGSGKTTVQDAYSQNFPRRQLQHRAVIPVLKVLTPEGPTVKSLAEAILIALGDPAASRGSAPAKTQRIIHFIRECGVEMLMLDEFHHFFSTRRALEGARVTDWLKNLFNSVNIPVVLFGLPAAITALNSNQQLRRRFSAPHYIAPFGFETADEQLLFRGVLAQLQSRLKVPCAVDFSNAEVARRFYYASSGLIDYVVKVADDAASRLHGQAAAKLTMASLAQSFRTEVWGDVPDELNPFAATGKLRRLDKPREPFEGWDDPAQYTLSRRAAALKGHKSRRAAQ